MLVHIPNVLDAAMLAEIATAANSLDFEDGASTAGWHARGVKHTAQARPNAALTRVQDGIVTALLKNSVFAALALPLRVAPPLVSRMGPCQHYGTHVDDAIMGRDQPMRSDISVTLFLSAPADYDGGELIAETLSGEDVAKFAAGDAVLYPATTLHRVNPVTRGVRLVAVTWVQSRVRDAAKREILFDLDRARRQMFERAGKSEAFDLISKSYANLLRTWAEV